MKKTLLFITLFAIATLPEIVVAMNEQDSSDSCSSDEEEKLAVEAALWFQNQEKGEVTANVDDVNPDEAAKYFDSLKEQNGNYSKSLKPVLKSEIKMTPEKKKKRKSI